MNEHGAHFRQPCLPECRTSDPSDHPYNHWLRWQDSADMDGTVAISRFCSAGDLLLRPACREPNTSHHHDWLHSCPHSSSKLMLSGAGATLFSCMFKTHRACFCFVGHPRVRFRPQSARAASAKALWKEEKPSCQPHPGSTTAHFNSIFVWQQLSVNTEKSPFMSNFPRASCLFSKALTVCLRVLIKARVCVLSTLYPFDKCAGSVCMGGFTISPAIRVGGVSLRI